MDASPTAPVTTADQPASSAPLRLTAKAVTQVKEVFQAQGFGGQYLMVRVVPSGCSGFGYEMVPLKEPKPADIVWEQDGLRIVTDALSSRYLAGCEVDFVVDPQLKNSGFKFSNPN